MKRYQDKIWIRQMRLRVDYHNMITRYVGNRGIDERALDHATGRAQRALGSLMAKRGTGMTRWMDLPYNQDEIIDKILQTAEQIRNQFDNFVVLGIGGSALGPIAVQQALNHLRYNELPAGQRGPRFYVIDNVDPEQMQALLDIIDVEKTCFNVITKSGSTSETMSQLLIIRAILENKLGNHYTDHIIATTDRERGNLCTIAQIEGFQRFEVPDGVGGRFSELCPVGLLPAAVCGIDIQEMIAGAAQMDQDCQNEDIYQNAALMGAMLMVLAMESGKNISVMMPYADSLRYMADWYAQLWGESLGKQYSLEGKEVFVGQTPVKALGVTDQHSQVQLYAQGPFDKVVTFLGVDRYRKDFPIPAGYSDLPDVAFLSGHSLNELIAAEQLATEYALLKAGKMNCTITLPEINAYTVGQLLYFFEMETAFAGELMNIDAFDQPGVEEGKNATYALLGRPGFEEKRAELDARPKKDGKYTI